MLLRDSMPLVERVASGLASRLPAHVDFSDLKQAGYVGLLDAVEKFDRHRGARLWTYAELRIRGAIIDSLRELDWAPRSIRRRRREIERATHQLEGALGRAPEKEELAAALGMSVTRLHRALVAIRRADAAVNRAQSVDEIATAMPDPSSPDPQESVLRRELFALLTEAIETLPERERLVLSLYYHEELTMKEVGQVLGVNESRVSQIHSKAVAALRLHLKDLLKPVS